MAEEDKEYAEENNPGEGEAAIVEDLESVKSAIVKRMKYLKHRKYDNESIDEFSLAFRVWLLKYLDLDYEFTEDELREELSKRRIKKHMKEWIIRISDLMEGIKYGGRDISKEEFNSLIDETISEIGGKGIDPDDRSREDVRDNGIFGWVRHLIGHRKT